eukprot:15434004-Alexandrium_andersonii.AAC.1
MQPAAPVLIKNQSRAACPLPLAARLVGPCGPMATSPLPAAQCSMAATRSVSRSPRGTARSALRSPATVHGPSQSRQSWK